MGEGMKRAIKAAKATRRRTPASKIATGIEVVLEKLGKVQRWTIGATPFADKPRLRSAYTRGFYTRTADWNMGRAKDVNPVYLEADKQDAYDQGYTVAQAQEQP